MKIALNFIYYTDSPKFREDLGQNERNIMTATTKEWEALTAEKGIREETSRKKLTEILARIAKRPHHMKPLRAAWSDFDPGNGSIYGHICDISPQRVATFKARPIAEKGYVILNVYHRKAVGEVGYAMRVHVAGVEVYFNANVRMIVDHFVPVNMSYEQTIAALNELDAIVAELEELYPA